MAAPGINRSNSQRVRKSGSSSTPLVALHLDSGSSNHTTAGLQRIIGRMESSRLMYCGILLIVVSLVMLSLFIRHRESGYTTLFKSATSLSPAPVVGPLNVSATQDIDIEVKPLPRGTCQLPCCSKKMKKLSPNTPQMPSMWWNNALSNGTRIHLVSAKHGSWVGPTRGPSGSLDWSAMCCQPGVGRSGMDPSLAFTVIRQAGSDSSSSIRLQTPAGHYVSVKDGQGQGGDGHGVVGDEALATPSTLFTPTYVDDSMAGDVLLQSIDGHYLACDTEGYLRKDASKAAEWERFRVLEVGAAASWRGVNLGSWLVLEDWMVPSLMEEGTATATARQRSGRKEGSGSEEGAEEAGGVSEDDSQLFPASMRDEWKLMKMLGGHAAKVRLEKHYRTFVTPADFNHMARRGVNAVRIPVGWWVVRSGATVEEWEFLQSHVAHLERAFRLASKYSMGVFLALHASPGPEKHSALEGQEEWGVFPELVKLMLDAVEWLAARFSQQPNFLGISLLSERVAQGMPAEEVRRFYLDGYAAVRRHSPCAFVGIAPRVKGDGSSSSSLKGFMLGTNFTNVLLEIHSYVAFNGDLANKNVLDTMTFVEDTVLREIRELQSMGHMVVVGEWSLALSDKVTATQKDMEELADVQLETYAQAKAGWFFWSLKMGRSGWPHWSFEESLAQGWLKKKSKGPWP